MVVQRALAGGTKIERDVSTKIKQNEVVEGCTEAVSGKEVLPGKWRQSSKGPGTGDVSV